LPIVSTGYVARPQFLAFHKRKQRWAVEVCHVRAGKTVAAVADLIDAALTCPLPDPRFAYVAPYLAQAKDVAWTYLKRYTAAIPGAVANESELRVDMPGGRRVRLYGSDNYKRIAGVYFDGVVMDEEDDQDPRAWSEVIRSRLSDRHGWAVFMGTPQGTGRLKARVDEARARPDEWFLSIMRASETGILAADELRSAREDLDDDQYAALYECSFEASVVGSYWGKAMAQAEADKRITKVRHDPDIAVDTWWDLGMDDAMAIWFTQNVGREVHVIDYDEDSGGGLPASAKMLQDKGYVYGTHTAPLDIKVRELSGKSRLEIAAGLGIRFQIMPDVPLIDGIDAARSFIGKCWFDREKTQRGRDCLVAYRRLWDGKRRVFANAPLHDWASHGADAFRTLAISHKLARPKAQPAQARRLVSAQASTAWMAS
jgi:hypothetical protein